MRFHRHVLALLVALIAISALPPARHRADAAAAGDTAPEPSLFECYNGAVPPPDALCLFVPLQRADGRPADNIEVTASLDGRSISARSQQLVNAPAGTAVATLWMNEIDARPGSLVELSVPFNGLTKRQLIGFRPNPRRRSQTLPIIQLDVPPVTSAVIWGTVWPLEAQEPLEHQEVRLYQGDELLASTQTAGKNAQLPFAFTFNPKKLQNDQLLRLETTYDNELYQVEFVWKYDSIKVEFVLAYACDGSLPRGGDSTNIPPEFCLVVEAHDGDSLVLGASIYAQIDQQAFGPYLTQKPAHGTRPSVALELGRLMQEAGADAPVRVIAMRDRKIGIYTAHVSDFQLGERWGKQLRVDLQADVRAGVGLAGGSPTAVAARGQVVYLGSPGGLAVSRGSGSPWLRVLGEHPHALPTPEISALLIASSSSQQESLLAGLNSGAVIYSTDSGATWMEILAPNGRPVRGLAASTDALVVVRGQERLSLGWRYPDAAASAPPTFGGQPPEVESLAFAPTALASLADNGLIAGASDGLHWYTGAGWNGVPNLTQAVTAVAAVWPEDTQLILAGTDQGLWLTNTAGVGQALDLPGPIYALDSTRGSTAGSWKIYAATPQGVFQAEIRSASERPQFTQQVAADGSDSTLQTTGMPDVQDLAKMPDGTILAAASSGVFTSSDNGLNWASLELPDPAAVRSVAALDQDSVLALTGQSLWSGQIRTHTWQPVGGLPGELNGVSIRAVGGTWLLGRAAGPGESLLISHDQGHTWTSHALGENRGVTSMATLEPPQPMRLLIGTDGDGVYGWSPDAADTLQRLPDLRDDTGQIARVSSLTVGQTPDSCQILAGTLGGGAGVAARPCDSTSVWDPLTKLTLADRNVGAVTGLLPLGSQRYLAASAAGFLLGRPGGVWGPAPFNAALRPQTLLLPADYAQMRRFLAGGPQSGALLFSDVAPDLAVTLDVPYTIKGGTTVRARLAFANQGLLPTNATTYALTIQSGQGQLTLLQPATSDVPVLGAGQSISLPLTLRADPDARPSLASLNVTTPLQEQFNANNTATAVVNVVYRDGPDLWPQLTAPILRPGQTSKMHLRVYNTGNRTSATATVTAIFPPEIPIASAPPASISGNTLIWQIQALPRDASVDLEITFTPQTTLQPNTTLNIPVRLQTSGDDVNRDNNTRTAYLSVPSAALRGLIVTNTPRLERQNPGQTDQINRLLQQIAQQQQLLILDLGNDPPCDPAGNAAQNLHCRYQTWDQTSRALAAVAATKQPDQDTLIQQRLGASITARDELVTRIRQRIDEAAKALPPKSYLYLIGGDSIIPATAEPDITISAATLNQGAIAERAQTQEINPSDTLYAVFRSNAYPSYSRYQDKNGKEFRVGVQAGAAADILPVLQAFLDSQGVLQLKDRNVAGSAYNLTQDTQQAICVELQHQGFGPAQACDSIPESVRAGLTQLGSTQAVSVFSGHSTARMIGDLDSATIASATIQQLNLLLLLGCHTGLVPDQSLTLTPALTAALARKRQPLFGFTGYAYARFDNADVGGQGAYAELLARALVFRLDPAHWTAPPPNDLTLGMLMEAAVADYRSQTSDSDQAQLHKKTLDTFTLYGPPMYRLQTPSSGTPAALRAEPPPAEQVTVQPSFSARQLLEGTIYTAAVDNGAALPLIEMGRSLQPGVLLRVPSGISSAVLAGGSYHDIPGVDPLFPRIAPLQSPPVYSEPAPVFPGFDWPDPPQVRPDGDGTPLLLAPLGSWEQRSRTQRLTDRLTLRLIRPSDPNAAPPSLTDQPTLCLLGHEVSITIDDGANIDQIEVVVLNNGSFEVTPLRLTGKTWRARVAIPEGRQLYLQAIGKNGTVIYLNNHGDNYLAPGKVTPCQPN